MKNNNYDVQPIKIDCANPDWQALLKSKLQEGREVDLSSFFYTEHGQLCETLALAHGMEFRLDARNHAGFFRKRPRK